VQEGEVGIHVGAPTTPTTGYSDLTSTNHIDGTGLLATGAIDTTADKTLDITWTWDSADAAKTLSIRGGVLYDA